jgi:hypothetical protein
MIRENGETVNSQVMYERPAAFRSNLGRQGKEMKSNTLQSTNHQGQNPK